MRSQQNRSLDVLTRHGRRAPNPSSVSDAYFNLHCKAVKLSTMRVAFLYVCDECLPCMPILFLVSVCCASEFHDK